MKKIILKKYLFVFSLIFLFASVSAAEEPAYSEMDDNDGLTYQNSRNIMPVANAESDSVGFEIRPYVSIKGAVSLVQSDFDLGYYYGGYHNHYYDNGYYYDNCYYHKHYDESGDTVFAGSAALGLKTKYVRFEFEYTHRTEASQSYRWFPDIKQEFDSYMFNAFCDFPVAPKIIPYAGLGLGMTHIKNIIEYGGYEESITKNCFSVGADLGVSFAVARHLNIDLGFRFIYMGGIEIEDEDLNMYAADFYFGLRYTI